MTYSGSIGPEDQEAGRRHIADFEADASVNLSTITISPDSSTIDEDGDAVFTLTASPPPSSPLDVVVTVAQTGNVAASGETGARTVTIDTDGSGTITVGTAGGGENGGSITVTVDDGEDYTVASSSSAATVTVSAAEVPLQNEFTYRLCARDHQREDGDDVNIFVNRTLVFGNYILRNEERCETIVLQRSPSRNSIRVQAISVGTPALTGNPPTPNVNTAQLRIRHATEDTVLEDGLWELDAGGQQLWDVHAISENQVTLTPVTTGTAQRQAIQGTVAGVAAATVSNVTSNIGARFSAPSGGVSVSLAGTPLVFGGPKHGKRGKGISSARGFDALGEEGWRHRTMTADDLLRSSSFEIALGASESDKEGSSGLANAITIWGRGDLQFFESGGGANDGYDGDLVAGYLGADIAMGDGWLVGVAVSRIAAEADYTLGGSADDGGALEVELTNIHPYIRAALNDSSEAWAILGAGTGELTDTGKGSTQTEASKSDMTMRMLSAGMRHRLDTDMGIDLAVLGDGSFATVETEDGTADVDGITADVWRARLGVEASHTSVSEGGSSFTTFLEVAARQDGGDGATGTGLELSPGVAFSDPASGFSLEARGRALAVHSADNHREYGASLTASVTPGANGRGLSLAISPVWGTPEDALGEADRSLFFGDAGERRVDNALSLNSRLYYGFSAGRGVVAPFAVLSLHDGDRRRLRIGSRYSLGSALDLELSGSAGSSGGSAQSVQVSGRIRF
ncbi:MAG: autotransporter outer membrane beta-barrel domain-containing protein [Alphaproteobacteria bacterium]|nr:autotransporter outer membrane beta-barrel domain-containing protein [Alphaproteobacteria bacterium]